MKLMQKKWKELEQLFVQGSRYIWTPLPKELNVDEWAGQAGLDAKAYGVLSDAMKAAFVAGHACGAQAALDTVNAVHNEFDFDPEADAFCAQRTWDKVKEEL